MHCVVFYTPLFHIMKIGSNRKLKQF